MHHEDIKAAIRKKGVTPAEIARHLAVTNQMVSSAIRGTAKSRRIADAIAKITGLSVDVLWPDHYGTGSARSKVSDLLGRTQAGAGK